MTVTITIDLLKERSKQLGFKIKVKNNLYYLIKDDQKYCDGDLARIDGYLTGIWDTIYTHHRNIMNGNLIDIWNIDDIKTEHPNLNDVQCVHILNFMKVNHDANIGINWDGIESAICELYPDYDL